MRLRSIDFGNVLGASGVQGFFGEGYAFHRLWKPFGLNFGDMTFVAKTATLAPRRGNMRLTHRFTPANPLPRCVRPKFWRALVLNSVGLSNPGIKALIDTRHWQKREQPFMLSVMTLADSPKNRLKELRVLIGFLRIFKNDFRAPFALQVNLSCPNTGHDPGELIAESEHMLEVAGELGVPVVPKFSIATAPINAVARLSNHPLCDGICVSNTLPFGWEGIDWRRVWGSSVSPLKHLGGGGLSGAALRPLVCHWIQALREAGFTKPINGGGGIMSCQDVDAYRSAGASSVFLGSVAILRPWRVKEIIRHANSLRWSE